MKKLILPVLIIFLMTGCARSMAVQKSLKSFETKKAAAGITGLETDIETGNMSVCYGNGDSVTVETNFKATGSDKDPDLNSILNKAKISLDENNSTEKMTIVNKDNGMNIWDWIRTSKLKVNFTADVRVTVPINFKRFSMNSNTGNIDMIKPSGLLSMKVNTGNITIQNPSLTGDCSAYTNTGNISCSFSDKQDKGSLSLKTDVGNIDISVDNSLVQASSMGANSNTKSFSQITLKNDFQVNPATDVGNISLHS